MLLTLSRRVLRRGSGVLARSLPFAHAHRVLPCLEQLEERCLLSFALPVDYPVDLHQQNGPESHLGLVVVGDFNNDGKPDLAASLYGAYLTSKVIFYGGVNILLGNGDGSFAGPVFDSTDDTPDAIAVGDFNEDGKQDLAVAFSTNVGILLGVGDGAFAPTVNFSSGGSPGAIAVGDFNGDGNQDLAVTNPSNDNVSVLLGKGDGSLAPAIIYSPGGSPAAIGVGDFNMDGKQDLAVSTNNKVSIFLNKGDGTFAEPVFSSIVSGSSIGVGDFNNDGKTDLATGSSILLGKGDGTFAPPISFPESGPALPQIIADDVSGSLVVGDFNSDGKADLAIVLHAHTVYENLSVLQGNGDGTFAPPIVITYPPSDSLSAEELNSITMGDFNEDGLPDLAVGVENVNRGGQDSGPIRILLGLPPVTLPPAGIGAFDSSSGTWYLRAESSGGAPDVGTFAYGAPGWVGVVGDWDGNGLASVGGVDTSTGTWYLRNENSAGTADAGTFQFGAPGWIPVVGDWGGSGHSSIGMFDPSTGIWYLRYEANAGAPDAGTFSFGQRGWIPVVGDWTGTRHVGVGVFDPSTATWYLRQESNAGNPDAGSFNYGVAGWHPVVGDWDGDGTTTVGAVEPDSSTGFATWFLRNSNSGGAADAGSFSYGLNAWQPIAGMWSLSQQPMAAPVNFPFTTAGLLTAKLASGADATGKQNPLLAAAPLESISGRIDPLLPRAARLRALNALFSNPL